MTFLDTLRGFFGGTGPAEPSPPDSEMITCEQALSLVQEFIDGELTDVSQAKAEKHFEICKLCYPHLKFEKSFREALRRAAKQDEAPAELRGRVLNALNEVEG